MKKLLFPKGALSLFCVGLLVAFANMPKLEAAESAVFDLSKDFSITNNPNGAWSYGYASTLNGPFTVFPQVFTSPTQNGVPVTFWAKNNFEPAVVYFNSSSETAISDNGQGVYPPGTVWFYAGPEGHPDNFSVIRFTVPAGKDGNHLLETAVRSFVDWDRSGDTDFHVLKNGTEIFGQFLPPRSGTGYTNILSLAAGDNIDFAIGRGQDGILYGSGLKITATFTAIGEPPPPPPHLTYDLERDYSTNRNPGDAWSYGWKNTIGGALSLYAYHGYSPEGFDYWVKTASSGPAAVYHNPMTNTVSGFAPGVVWFHAGYDGNPDNLSAIRFTVPDGGSGAYVLESTVRPFLDSGAGDTDFHIVKNGTEFYSVSLAGNAAPNSYSNNIVLAAGDQVDFLIGRGADGREYGSALRIKAKFTLLDSGTPVAPSILQQPQSATANVGESVTFNVLATGTQPLSYQWRLNGSDLPAKTGSSLTLSNVQQTQAGNYSVRVSNQAGSVISADAVFTVTPQPPPGVTYDLQRDYSTTQNPAGTWSYGWKSTLDGTLNLYAYHGYSPEGFDFWVKTASSGPAAVYHNPMSNTVSGFAPGVVWFHAGYDGNPDNFSAIRFSVPDGGSGTYRLESTVRPFLDSGAGDTDFHIIKNGTELYSVFLAGNALPNSYSNRIALTAGDQLDFLIGRGADGREYGSALKIKATLTLLTDSPPPPPPAECTQRPAGLVAWWPFDGSFDDVKGGHTGMPFGDPAFVAGEVGPGLNFDYVDDRVRVPASPDLNVGAGAGFTIEGWIKPNDLTLQHPIVEWNDDAGLIGAHFWINQTGPGGVVRSLFANIVDVNGTGHGIVSGPDLLNTASFQHVALTYDKGSGSAALYINGNAVTQQNLGTFTPQTSSHLYIGYRSSGTAAGNRFNGVIDELSLYDRALSSSELQSIFAAGAAGKCKPTPPPPPLAYDVERDFSPTQNPAGVWSYGWKATVPGPFSLLSYHGSSGGLDYWLFNSSRGPAVYHNSSSNTVVSNEGQGTYPPGTTWMGPGYENTPENYSVIRFTVPENGAGTYQLDAAVRSALQGSLASDCDFHVLHNSVELFGQNVPGNQGTQYANRLTLSAGDTVDFVTGRGADNREFGSALKIKAKLTFLGDSAAPPTIVSQPQSTTVQRGQSATFSVTAEGTAPLSYQWRFNGSDIGGQTGSSLTLNDVQFAQAGTYSVRVSNAAGSVLSADATLTVRTPPPPPPTNCTESASGLVAWWPFDGNFRDIQGGHDGTPSGNPSFVSGEVGQGLSFDYVDDRVRVEASPELNIGAGGGFTIETWINPKDLSVQHPIAEWNNDQGFIGAHFWTSQTGFDGVNHSLFANLIDVNGVGHGIASGDHLLNTGEFQHVALTYDKASGAAALYINGSAVAQQNLGTFTPQTTSHFYIGYRSSGTAAGNRFNGAIDELSLYNRALSASEIEAVYSASTLGKCKHVPPPAEGTYDFERDYSQTQNPAGQWSYGWKQALDSAFTLYPFHGSDSTANATLDYWMKSAGAGASSVYHNNGPGNYIHSEGSVFPPGALWFSPGYEGNVDNFGVIRFTVPAGGDGLYRVESTVRSVLTSSQSGDYDFHVARNNTELFGRSMPPRSSVSYSNSLALAAGDTIDLAVGRGADNREFGSAVFVSARLVRVGSQGENHAPVARINLQPTVTLSPGQTNLLVIAANGSNAVVVLDGTGSSDPDNDPLTFAWFVPGRTEPFSTEDVTLNTASVGTHTVVLVVNDGQASGSATVTFEVITASEAVAEISRLVGQANLPRKIENPLQASLKEAMKSFERGDIRAAVSRLHSFQKKVEAQVSDQALASQLANAIADIIESLGNTEH